MTLLLTGFEPFGTHAENPSQDIVQAIEESWTSDEELIVRVLPVEYRGAGKAILDLIARAEPRAILMLGLADSAALPRLERVALNLDDAGIADNAGVTRRGETIRVGAPLALKTGIDLLALQAHLAGAGHGVEISNHAGAYICNHIYFEALHRLAELGAPTPCLFVHVPPYPTEPSGRAAFLAQHAALVRDLIAVLANPGTL